VAGSLKNRAAVLLNLGKPADAEPLARDALRMATRLVARYAAQTSEGDALTLLAAQPSYRDAYLSVALERRTDPAAVYAEVWASKGAVARAFGGRLLAARAAADPDAAKLLTDLAAARRRRADLILAPLPTDLDARMRRDDDLEELARTVARLDRDLRPRLPAVGRAERLAAAVPADLQEALPPTPPSSTSSDSPASGSYPTLRHPGGSRRSGPPATWRSW
jgi:hypothetical protein